VLPGATVGLDVQIAGSGGLERIGESPPGPKHSGSEEGERPNNLPLRAERLSSAYLTTRGRLRIIILYLYVRGD